MRWPKDLTDPSYAPMVLGAVAAGNYEHTFVPLTVTADGQTATFQVSQDALKIDGIRINASPVLQQHIADLLNARLLTPKLLDQMWAQRAVTLTPCTQSYSETTAAMIAHSACVDAKLAVAGGLPAGGIVQTVGKTWVLDNALLTRPGMACNMGWHIEQRMQDLPFDTAPTLPGAHMIQSPGYAHSATYPGDYSQVCLFVLASSFDSIVKSPTLATLANADGVLRVLRQPGAPELVSAPRMAAAITPDAGTVILTAFGAGIGASIGGPGGAFVGGGIGWAVDAIRRKLLA